MSQNSTLFKSSDYKTQGIHSPRYGEFIAGKNRPLMAMIEITNRCNMDCPVCFSDANHPKDDKSISEIQSCLERLLVVADGPVPIQISGGEPTIRSGLPEIIELAQGMGYRNIELITNGIKISREPWYLLKLREKGLTSVYLQFDGLNKETYLKIRGQDMTEVRLQAIESIRQSGLCCALAVVVTRGVNDEEIGDIVQFGIENIDTIRAINFQSAARFTGRFLLDQQEGGYTLSDLLKLIEKQTGLSSDTFRSEHLGHPLCNSMSLVFLVNGRMEPLFQHISRKEIIEFLVDMPRDKVMGLFSGKKEFFYRCLSDRIGIKLIKKLTKIFGNNPLNILRSKHITLFAKSFMEKDVLDPKRIHQCCYAISDTAGVFSFCAFNNLYRFPGHRQTPP